MTDGGHNGGRDWYTYAAMTTFVEKLDAACEAKQSLLCVGLDPDPQLMPVADVLKFNKAIVDATHNQVCAFKPNMAFYEALGLDGLKALSQTINHIRKVSPKTIIIADAKRGDIGHVSAAYASAMFDHWEVDVVTVHGYMGRDSVAPFASRDGKGAFVLCRTSNPGAGDFQDMENSENLPLYQRVAGTAAAWGFNGSLGLVVGATYPGEMKAVRDICPSMPLLIPGVGSQSGDLRQAVLNGTDSRGRRAIINASRSILYASSGPDYAEAAGLEAKRLRDSINAILESEGLGWR